VQFGRDCDFNIALEYAVPFADGNINIVEKSDIYSVVVVGKCARDWLAVIFAVG